MSKKQSNTLGWVALLGIGAVALWYFFFRGDSTLLGGGGSGSEPSVTQTPGGIIQVEYPGGAGAQMGAGYRETITKTIYQDVPSVKVLYQPGPGPVLQGGSIIQQVRTPNVKYNNPLNTVIVKANVSSGYSTKPGWLPITVVPLETKRALPAPYKAPAAQAPLKITNVFGFPIVPLLAKNPVIPTVKTIPTVITQAKAKVTVKATPVVSKCNSGLCTGSKATTVIQGKGAYKKPGGM